MPSHVRAAAKPAVAALPSALPALLASSSLPSNSFGLLFQPVGRPARPLISLNAEQPFQLASTTKLVTTLAALGLLGPDCRWRTRAAIWIALLTDCRRGEALALDPEDIGADTITARAGHTKTLRTRAVPIVPVLRPWLAHVLLDVVRDILGHTTIRTMERYAHALVHRQRTALEGLGRLAGLHQPPAPGCRCAG